VLARSQHFGVNELTVLLDVLADRVLLPDAPLLLAGEPDRLAMATMHVLRRNVLDLKVLEPWVVRLSAGANAYLSSGDRDPYQLTGNAQAFLRALHLQLSLAAAPPAVRSDMLLVLIEALRGTNQPFMNESPPS